jgi:hypothetical protein
LSAFAFIVKRGVQTREVEKNFAQLLAAITNLSS